MSFVFTGTTTKWLEVLAVLFGLVALAAQLLDNHIMMEVKHVGTTVFVITGVFLVLNRKSLRKLVDLKSLVTAFIPMLREVEAELQHDHPLLGAGTKV